jgi:hypothetical protein
MYESGVTATLRPVIVMRHLQISTPYEGSGNPSRIMYGGLPDIV